MCCKATNRRNCIRVHAPIVAKVASSSEMSHHIITDNVMLLIVHVHTTELVAQIYIHTHVQILYQATSRLQAADTTTSTKFFTKNAILSLSKIHVPSSPINRINALEAHTPFVDALSACTMAAHARLASACPAATLIQASILRGVTLALRHLDTLAVPCRP